MTVQCPVIATWEEAFAFASREIWAAFEALSAGDLEGARTLNESAQQARRLAEKLNEGHRDQ